MKSFDEFVSEKFDYAKQKSIDFSKYKTFDETKAKDVLYYFDVNRKNDIKQYKMFGKDYYEKDRKCIKFEGGASRIVINEKKYGNKPIAIGWFESVGVDYDVYVSTDENLLKQFRKEYDNVKEINLITTKQAIDEFIGI